MAKRKKQTKPKYRKTTPQDISFGFNTFAESITEALNKYAHRQSEPEVKRLYITYRQSIANWMAIAKKYLNQDFSALPNLIGNDFYSGLTRLAEFCKCAAQDKPEPPNLIAVNVIPQHFQVTERTIYRWIDKGRLIPYPDTAGKTRVDACEVAKWAKSIKK